MVAEVIDLDTEPTPSTASYESPPLLWHGYHPGTVAVIIPCRKSDLDAGLALAERYEANGADEVIIVTGTASPTDARNCGAVNAHSEWLVFSDDDAFFQGSLDHIRHCKADWGCVQFSGYAVDHQPNLYAQLNHAIFRAVRNIAADALVKLPSWAVGMLAGVGTFMFVRHDAFFAVGGCDNTVFPEDNDLAARLCRAGYKYHYINEPTVDVSRPWTPLRHNIGRYDEWRPLQSGKLVWTISTRGHFVAFRLQQPNVA